MPSRPVVKPHLHKMVVLNEFPPMFDQIDAVFHVRGTGAIFTFGNRIYVPSGGDISRELYAHEAVHHEQQTDQWDNIQRWWARYLVDPSFRFSQELPAHRAEYLAYCKRHGSGRDKFLDHVAGRLSGPLYLGMLSREKAKEAILCNR